MIELRAELLPMVGTNHIAINYQARFVHRLSYTVTAQPKVKAEDAGPWKQINVRAYDLPTEINYWGTWSERYPTVIKDPNWWSRFWGADYTERKFQDSPPQSEGADALMAHAEKVAAAQLDILGRKIEHRDTQIVEMSNLDTKYVGGRMARYVVPDVTLADVELVKTEEGDF